MSSMLEQAIIDAEALKEAALRNAESVIMEKYASEIKEAMDSLLEVEDEFGLGLEPEPVPELVGPEDDIALAAAEEEELCGCPEEGEKLSVEFSIEDLKDIEASLPAGEPLEEPIIPPTEEAEEEELELAGLQEEIDIEIDEELLFEYPEAAEGQPVEETIDVEELEEALIVDLMGDELTGWAGRPESDKQFAREIRVAKLAATEAKEQKEEFQAAIENLAETKKDLENENYKLKELIFKLKDKLEEVNLSNAKLLYTNRTLNSTSLNERQKNRIAESIQQSDSVEEAKVIYETLQSAVGESQKSTPKSLNEAIRKPSLTMSRRRGGSSPRDSVVRNRFQTLAGIKK